MPQNTLENVVIVRENGRLVAIDITTGEPVSPLGGAATQTGPVGREQPLLSPLRDMTPTAPAEGTAQDARELVGASLPLVAGLATAGMGALPAMAITGGAGIAGDMLSRGSMTPEAMPGAREAGIEGLARLPGALAPPMMRQAIRLGSGSDVAQRFARQVGDMLPPDASLRQFAERILGAPGANISPTGAARTRAGANDAAEGFRASLQGSPDVLTANLASSAEPGLQRIVQEALPGAERAGAQRATEAAREGLIGDRMTRGAGGRLARESPAGSINPGGRIGRVEGPALFDTMRAGRMQGGSASSSQAANELIESLRKALPGSERIVEQDALAAALEELSVGSGMLGRGTRGDVLSSNAIAGAAAGGPTFAATGSMPLSLMAALAAMGLVSPRGVSTLANSAQTLGAAQPLLAAGVRGAVDVAPAALGVDERRAARREPGRRQLTP